MRAKAWAGVLVGAAVSILVTSCNGLVYMDSTDTNTNWYVSCDEDAQCGEELACICGMCTRPCEDHEGCLSLPGAWCATDTSCQTVVGVCMAEEPLPRELTASTLSDVVALGGSSSLEEGPSLDDCELLRDELHEPERRFPQGVREYSCPGDLQFVTICDEAGDAKRCQVARSDYVDFDDEEWFGLATLVDENLSPIPFIGEMGIVHRRPWTTYAGRGSFMDVVLDASSQAFLQAFFEPNVGACVDENWELPDQCLAVRRCDDEVPPTGQLFIEKQLNCWPEDDVMRCRCGTIETTHDLAEYSPDYCQAHLPECFAQTTDW